MPAALLAQVEFIEGSWQEARAMAAEQDKYIMVDAYTDWCYWCKVQDKETFAREDVGEMVNAHFVPVKIHAEQGVGVDLRMKYRIQGFPTLLFFDSEGRLVGRMVGYNDDPEAWMAEANAMLDPEQHPPSPVDPDLLDPGFPDWFKASFLRDGVRGTPVEPEVVSAWLDEQEDPFSEVAYIVISMKQTNEAWEDFFVENAATYRARYGEAEVMDKITNIYMMRGYRAMNDGDEAALEEVVNEAREQVGDELADMIDLRFRMDLYMAQGKYEEYFSLAEQQFEADGELNLSFINQVCWNVYENIDSPEVLESAVAWMTRVAEVSDDYNYLDTYAALLLKAGDLDGAEKWARKAIEAGEAKEVDVSGTEGLLEEIKAAREEG